MPRNDWRNVRTQLENYTKPGGLFSWVLGACLAVYETIGQGRPSTYAIATLLMFGPLLYKTGNGNGGSSGQAVAPPQPPESPNGNSDSDTLFGRVDAFRVGLLTCNV